MTKVQVKYCYSEKELNKFLLGLNAGKEAHTPYLINVQYMANVHGQGVETNKPDEEDVVAKADVSSDIVAIVQYAIELEVAHISDVSSIISNERRA